MKRDETLITRELDQGESRVQGEREANSSKDVSSCQKGPCARVFDGKGQSSSFLQRRS